MAGSYPLVSGMGTPLSCRSLRAKLRARMLVACSSDRLKSSHRGLGKGKGKDVSNKDALIKSLGEVSKSQGRVAARTNMVLGGEDGIDKWKQLDKKVNEYPCQRQFKCVGVSDEGFQDSMVNAVEDVLNTKLHPEMVNTRPSSKGNYISIQIGPVLVRNPDEVLGVFSAMKQDKRLKWVM